MSLTAFICRCPHCGHDHGENSLFDVARGTLTPSQQAKVNEQFANYAKQKPHLYGGCDEIISLPDLATPVMNRIRAEGMRMAVSIFDQPHREYFGEAIVDLISAKADELEQSK